MNQNLATKEEIVFTCGFFGDAFDVLRYTSENEETAYLVRWRPSIGAGLTDEFFEHLDEHMDDDDEEFARWEGTVTDKNTPVPAPEPDPSPSFHEAIDRSEIGIDLLRGQPVFVHADIRDDLRNHVERMISGLTEDERRSFGDEPLTDADKWFEREWPVFPNQEPN